MTLSFDDFGWERLEAEARREEVEIEEVLARAASYFQSELPTARPGTRVLDLGPTRGASARHLTMRLPRRHLDRLRAEADRQHVELDRLLEHAAIYYCADVDAGRVAERVAKEADEDR